MNIYVCVKQVPDTETKIKLAGDSIDLNGIKWIMSPYDQHAVEEAIKIKASNTTAVITAITVGPKARCKEALITAIAMGADEGIVVDAPENVDNFATAKAIAGAIKAAGAPGLVLTGKLAIDDNQMAVSQLVAEFLGIPHSTVVSKAEYSQGSTLVEREIEGGAKEVVQLSGPCLIGANKGLNNPRYPSLPGIMKAKKKVFKELSLAEVGVTASDSKVKYSKYQLPPERPSVKMLTGEPGDQATQLVKLLREEAKVL